MISTKDLSGLPNAERLKNFCKGLAALDIIMVEEEWSFIRHYTYNPAWRKGKEAFFATDGSDQSMIVMFAPEGCVYFLRLDGRWLHLALQSHGRRGRIQGSALHD